MNSRDASLELEPKSVPIKEVWKCLYDLPKTLILRPLNCLIFLNKLGVYLLKLNLGSYLI